MNILRKLGLVAAAVALAAGAAHGAGPASVSLPPIVRAPTMTETLLASDDGEYGTLSNQFADPAGGRLAVMFEAPYWAEYVAEIHYYIMDDGMDQLGAPGAPTTKGFIPYVWAPNEQMLPGAGVAGANPGRGYAEDAWLVIRLEPPVEITDDSWPVRRFFAGLQWLYDRNPVIGLDDDEPIDQTTCRAIYEDWDWLINHDAMIRAVAASSPSPVEQSTWSSIKALFR